MEVEHVLHRDLVKDPDIIAQILEWLGHKREQGEGKAG